MRLVKKVYLILIYKDNHLSVCVHPESLDEFVSTSVVARMRMQEPWSRDLILFAILKRKGQVFSIRIAVSSRINIIKEILVSLGSAQPNLGFQHENCGDLTSTSFSVCAKNGSRQLLPTIV
jgi:hypothetical protein